MAKVNGNRWQKIYILLLTILSVGNLEHSDWVAEMEDAFATESEQSGMMCKRNANDKWIFCRYQNDERIALSTLSPCLCTHIVLNTAISRSIPRIMRNLRLADANIQVLASVSTSIGDLQNTSQSSQKMLDWLNKQRLNGVDLRLEKKDILDNILWNKFIKYLQDINISFKENVKNLTLSTTINNEVLLHMKDSQLLEISSYVDFITTLPESQDSQQKRRGENNINDMLSKTEKIGFVKRKLLSSISIRNSLEKVMNKMLTTEKYPELCKYLDYRTESTFAEINHTVLATKNLFENIKEQVQLVDKSGIAGIDIWYLNDDDNHNTCKIKHFPIINMISTELKGERKTFNSFADLDIVFATGESQLDEIQVLHEPNTDPEEMRKFKCERIGFYRHPTDCTKFYHCAEHRATSAQSSTQYAVFVYKCPSGLVYDELHGSCNWPSYSDPCQGSDELLPVPPKKFQCTIPGFHVDPEDCRWFYYCSDLGDGRLAAFEFLCPSHLLGFDEQELLCNWKWMVPTCSNLKSFERDIERQQKSSEGSIDVENREKVGQISDKRSFKIFETASTFTPDWDDYSQAEIISNRALNMTSDDLNASMKKTGVNSFVAEELLKRKDMSFEYANLTDSMDRSIHKSSLDRPLSNVKNTTERKYGTAYWHRSMVTTKLPQNHQRNRFDLLLGNNNNSDNFRNDGDKIDHKYGIGTVRRININSPPLQVNRIEGTLSKNQGRSLGDTVATSYHFENTLNDHGSVNKNKPYSQVKCSKLINKDTMDDSNGNEDSFGCVGEVSLTVHVKEGKEADRYIIKPNQFSKIQESEQAAVLINNNTDTNSFKYEKLQEKYSVEEVSPDNFYYNEKQTDQSENLYTQGRSVSIERKLDEVQIDDSLKINKDSESINSYRNYPKIQVPLNFNSPRTQLSTLKRKPRIPKNEGGDIVNADLKTDNGTGTKHLLNSNVQTNKLMPLVFFPEGVLLNVDLNQINEISPQILLEVDIMLKSYMNDGNIDLHLLMQKLNATAEPMADTKNDRKMTSNEIDDMIEVIENLLNSTDIHFHDSQNASSMDITEKSLKGLQISTTIENNTDLEDLNLQYENLTKNSESSNISREMEMKINADSGIIRNNSKVPEIRKGVLSAEKILESPENKPFVRRRLFRKFKFPSIREQLESQTRSGHYNLENSLNYKTTTTTTEAHVLMSNRHRYPSIRQQLFLNNKRKTLNARNNVIWKRLQEMKLETATYDSNTKHTNTSIPFHQLEDDIAPTKDNQFHDRELDSNSYRRANHFENRDINLKSHQFGDRKTLTDINLYFNSNHQRSLTVDEDLSHGEPILENNRDTSFVGSSKEDNQRVLKEPTIVTIDYNSKIPLENRNIPNVNNLNFVRKRLHDDRYKYSLPLPPVRTRDYPSLVSPMDGESSLHRDSSEPSVRDSSYNKIEGTQRPRKTRKLRILVRKRIPETQSNENSPSARSDDSKIDQEENMRMRIPKKLINELRSNVLKKLALDGKSEVKLQIQFQDHVWNVPFVNDKNSVDISPVACTRPGLFQHPKDCNMFYECFWDKWLQRFTLHVFSCPVRLVYDDSIRGCSRPSFESHCRNSVEN